MVIGRLGACSFCAVIAIAIGACSSDSSSSDSREQSDAASVEPPTSTLPQTCIRKAKSSEHPPTCNGAAELCARTYDRVVVPFTHNAMSNADEGWAVPNQTHGIARQLTDGVRGLMLDVHYYDPERKNNAEERLATATLMDQIELCHSSCLLGRARLLDGLCAVTSFLDEHPAEVISIIFENYVADADLAAVLHEAGIEERSLVHASGSRWPTLREMIDSDKRVVVFLENNGGDPPYLHRAFVDNIWDTPYTFDTKEAFNCQLNRGKKTDPLFLINHWLGRPTSNIALATEVNVKAVLEKRVTDCTTEAGRPPTFVGVDFYEVGDLFAVVRSANGL